MTKLRIIALISALFLCALMDGTLKAQPFNPQAVKAETEQDTARVLQAPRPPFHLETKPSHRWDLTITQEHAPFTGFVYYAVPPNDPCQTIESIEMFAKTKRGRIDATMGEDLSPLHKPLLKLQLDAKRQFQVIVHVVVDFHNTVLKPGAPERRAEPLTPVERREFLKDGWPTPRAREWFHKWMVAHDLIRRQGEDASDFAFRVLAFMQSNFRYVIPDDIPEFKRMVKNDPIMGDWHYVIKTSTGECWRISDTYCRIMRMNGIPARLVSGNFVKNNSDETGHHLRSLIHLPAVGWIPIEDTAAVSMKDKSAANFFGTWGGAMLIGNENIDFKLPGPNGGWTIGTLDGVVYGPSNGDLEYPDLKIFAKRIPAVPRQR